MSRIIVCPLSRIDDVIKTERASHLLTLLGPDYMISHHGAMPEGRHLRVRVHDIPEPLPGQIAPQRGHAEQVLAFADTWDRVSPMVIHCWAGISRSTAAMWMTLCKLNPQADEFAILSAMRERAPHIAPNRLLVAHADDLLGRDGRMVDALDAAGPAIAASEGFPFSCPSISRC
ncbi:MAG: hypothetical protein QM698_03330 [Micropepsaceae bacterium]